MTYQQAYSKIIDAYFKDEIEPYDPQFCFCGNLCDKTENWYNCILGFQYHFPSHGYSGKELWEMESALLAEVGPDYEDEDEGEEDLFKGMCAALDVLKEIHRSRGENVDEDIPAFTKRELVKVH